MQFNNALINELISAFQNHEVPSSEIQLQENSEVKLLKLPIELKIKVNTIRLTFGTKAFVYSSHNEFADCGFLEFWDHSICFF